MYKRVLPIRGGLDAIMGAVCFSQWWPRKATEGLWPCKVGTSLSGWSRGILDGRNGMIQNTAVCRNMDISRWGNGLPRHSLWRGEAKRKLGLFQMGGLFNIHSEQRLRLKKSWRFMAPQNITFWSDSLFTDWLHCASLLYFLGDQHSDIPASVSYWIHTTGNHSFKVHQVSAAWAENPFQWEQLWFAGSQLLKAH